MPQAEKGVRGKGRQPFSSPRHWSNICWTTVLYQNLPNLLRKRMPTKRLFWRAIMLPVGAVRTVSVAPA
jgi:hypothetical protein